MEHTNNQRAPSGQPTDAAQVFAGENDTAALLRGHDWDASALGAPARWPAPLRTAVQLVMDAPVPMWLAWGPSLPMVYNQPYVEMLGNKHPGALGAPLREVWREMWAEVEPLVSATLSGQALYREDLELPVNRDGVERRAWFSFSYTPLRGDDGVVHGLICTVWETTEKVQSQRKLIAGEAALTTLLAQQQRHRADTEARHAQEHELFERYRLATLATNDAIWDWRLADGHVVWNQALTDLFGHVPLETSAQWWLDHIHPDDRARIDADIHRIIEGTGTAWTGEYRFLRADGSYAYIFDRGSVLRDGDGNAVRMIGAMLDLSERRASAAALRESERQFQTLFERMDEGFCVIEFVDGPHGPLSDYVHVAANPAYLANAGIPNVVGQYVRTMVPGEAAAWVETYRNVLLTGEPILFERELVATGRYLELSAFRIDPPERRQVAVLFQDGTQRHRAELALRELNETLERRVEHEVADRL